DIHEPHYRKNAFDAGEDGLGKNAHSLRLGCDCLGVIHYFDAHFPNFEGGSHCIKNAVCLHEEDHGLLWKHVNWRTGHTASMRSRRLVISFFCTVANYEYGFFFYLYMDGTVQSEVKLTGVQHGPNRPIPTDELSPQALSILAGGLARAQCLRRSCATANTVVEINVAQDPAGPQNPHRNGFGVHETKLERELEGRRCCSTASSRHWEIRSSTKVGAAHQRAPLHPAACGSEEDLFEGTGQCP
ncbi:hypothetical protein CYMTET_28456, partial [Cymbomonas tetramitiformis]